MTARRKRRDGLITRERLIETAIRILSKEGLGALSTVRVAREAGTVQSGLYVHFDSLEALTLAAAARTGERLREPLLAEMARFRSSVAAAPDTDALRTEHYLRLLVTLRREWRFLELVLRYRREPAPLGRVMADFMAQVREDVARHLLALGGPVGVEAQHLAELRYYAHLLTMLMVGAAEALEDELHPEPRRAVADLARQVEGLVRAAFGAVTA